MVSNADGVANIFARVAICPDGVTNSANSTAGVAKSANGGANRADLLAKSFDEVAKSVD